MSVPHREDPPNRLRSLETRIQNIAKARDTPLKRVQRAVANVVVGQMLPPSVVKGGTAMKLRVGEAGSRFTPDFDATRDIDSTLDGYIDQLRGQLAAGWGGFTGTVEVLEPPKPEGVPEEYVMQPFEIKLAFKGNHWLTVKFELGHDEIGSTKTPEHRISDDLVDLFAELGLPVPAPIPVLAVEHQVAQKLHACTSIWATSGGNDRAHDLVDLQVLHQEEPFDMTAIRATCQRLFAARQSHEWPPTVVAHDRWDTIYAEAADGLGVRGDVAEAVAWANELIAEIAAS